MIILILFILLVIVIGIGFVFASKLPGGITIDLASAGSYELGVVPTILFLIAIGGAVALVWWLLASFVTLPKRFSRSRKASKVRDANRALADGLLAAEAGDALLAKKLSKKAAQHADDDRLKLLLEARAAEVADDWSSAERAWAQLTRLPGGQLAGLRGAASAASARGDTLSAQSRAREALELKSAAEWPFNSLFDSQVADANWQAALSTLSVGEKRGYITDDSLRRRRSVLLTARALAMQNAERKDAQRLLAEAIRSAPGFPPAAWHGARHLMIDGKFKAAQGVLELGWKARPHPALAQLSGRLDPQANAETVTKRLEGLIAANPDHRESRILKAELAMSRKDWLSAVKALALLVEENPTSRLCLLLEKALNRYGDPSEADRWGRMAITASREPEWSDIDPKGAAFDYAPRDWARLVYTFGDTGQLVHPRYESSARELAAGRTIALPGPGTNQVKVEGAKATVTTRPLDYAPEDK